MSEQRDESAALAAEADRVVSSLPEEIRDLVAGWIRQAYAAEPGTVEAELVADARECRRRFRSASAEVSRIISE